MLSEILAWLTSSLSTNKPITYLNSDENKQYEIWFFRLGWAKTEIL